MAVEVDVEPAYRDAETASRFGQGDDAPNVDSLQSTNLRDGSRTISSVRETDPYYLSDYLLGADHSGPGLLRRVSEKVRELSGGYQPRFKTGSVMGANVDLKHDSGEVSDDAPVMELAMALIEWRSQATSRAASRQALISYLARNRITDEDMVIGSQRVGKGLLYEVRRDVRDLLTSEVGLEHGVERCLSLARMLRDWLDTECIHVPYVLPSDDPKIVVVECVECGCRLQAS
jgi:hypothetical protein